MVYWVNRYCNLRTRWAKIRSSSDEKEERRNGTGYPVAKIHPNSLLAHLYPWH